MSLKKETINGVFWSVIERFGSLGIQFLITVIIARILTPADYGLIGMLFIFTSLGSIILDSGFGQALIRKNDVHQIDYSSIFYVNIVVSLAIYILLFLLSPTIAVFFETPKLESIGKLIFLIFPINAISLIQNTIVTKNVAFKLLTKVSFISNLLSGGIAIYMAYNNYGVWALVYQTILFSLFRSILLWIYNDWRPSLQFDIKPVKEMFAFSSNLLLTNVIIIIFNNVYTLIIAKFYPIAQVGYYNQAKRFQEISSQTLTSIVQRVTFPVLAKIQQDDEKLQSAYRKVINQTVFLNFPLMLGLLAMADNFFYVLLTNKWMPAVPYFQLLCVYGALFPLHSINVNILKVKGKGKKLLIMEIVRRFIIIVAIVFTFNKGIEQLLIGHVISSIISILLNMYYCGKEINLKLVSQIYDVLPSLIISIVGGFVTFFIGRILPFQHGVLILSIQIIAMTMSYLFLCSLFKLDAYIEMKNIILKNKN